MSTLHTVVDEILDARSSTPSHRSVLTAITGIDGCGKAYVTARIVDALQTKGGRAVAINVDGWLNLPNMRSRDGARYGLVLPSAAQLQV